MDILIALAIGFVLDLMIGDPHQLPHPVRLIGFFIKTGEKMVRKCVGNSEKGQLVGGTVLATGVIALSVLIPTGILWAAGQVNGYVKIGIEAVFCYQILATKSLRVESMRVYNHLVVGDIDGARKYLSWIVGRDTQQLNTTQITKAAVETVAENTSDGVIAPLIFIAIGGAPLGFFYKAINTMDSMIGYKNEKYLYLGRFAARLDDVVNFIPAMVSAYCMIAASALLKLNVKNAIKIYKRDKTNHASPNSAKTESVCAGALGVQLAGDSVYFGKTVKKQTIGDAIRPIEIADIPRANHLMTAAAVVAWVCGLAIRGAVVWW